MKSARRVSAAALVLLILLRGPHSIAADLELSGVMDDGSRWYEIFSDAFAEVGAVFEELSGPVLDCPSLSGPQGRACDGFFFISDLPDLVSITAGTGDVVFTRGNLLDLGTITYDDSALTGTGIETAAVTGYTADFAVDIADDDSLGGNTSYSTTISNLSGVVNLIDGEVVDLTFSGDIELAFDPTGAAGGPYPETGTIVYENQRFQFLVGAVPGKTPFDSNFMSLEWGWDISGTVDQVFIAGDHDGDADADVADILAWQREFAEEGLLLAADNNADLVVDGADQAIWATAFGLGAASSAVVSVPEPGGVLAILIMALLPTMLRLR